TGFHPSMPEIQELFNNKQMNIVHGVSYANPNYSHFRAADIWLTGSSAEVSLKTGWLGRAQEVSYPGYPVDYPDKSAMKDPLAIQIGVQASIVTQSSTINTAFTGRDEDSFYKLVIGEVDETPDNAYGHELNFLRLMKQQTNAYTAVITDAFNKGDKNGVYPADNALAAQLKIVARLIQGGLTTPVYVVNHPNSFDTHSSQTEGGDATKGSHANMLAILSQAVGAFQKDLAAKNVVNRVASMTFTEFGRRIKSNDSGGTDHGVGNPVFFFGPGVNPVIIGTNPDLPNNATVNDQVPMQYDFRAVYYSVLQQWFEMTESQLQQVLFQPYTSLPIFQQIALPVHLISFTGKWPAEKVNLQWEVDQESGIDYYEVERSTDGVQFQKIGTVDAVNSTIRYTYQFNDGNLSASLYYYRLRIVEVSGSVELSNVIVLKSAQSVTASQMKVMPNPMVDRFTVYFENRVSGQVTARLIDIGGKEVWKTETNVAGVYSMPFTFTSKRPVGGVYLLSITTKTEQLATKVYIR
ncbi:MAG TPA: DUF1501 domain-containing protein, partial [Chitinophagaceae bacterium]|nr:DUF1501 domain-containing protein [Chitinophagaceae bacterium]